MATYEDVQISGNTKTTSKYTCETANLSYTIIGSNISEDFQFLNRLSEKLDEMLSQIRDVADKTTAFYFENGATANEITHAYNELKNDVALMQSGLSSLYSAFMTDIDNVNAELKNNFGYWAFNKAKLAGKTTETIETPSK